MNAPRKRITAVEIVVGLGVILALCYLVISALHTSSKMFSNVQLIVLRLVAILPFAIISAIITIIWWRMRYAQNRRRGAGIVIFAGSTASVMVFLFLSAILFDWRNWKALFGFQWWHDLWMGGEGVVLLSVMEIGAIIGIASAIVTLLICERIFSRKRKTLS